MGQSIEDFEPIFGKVIPEFEENPSNSLTSSLLPHLFHVHATDSSHIKIHVTDFHSYTWEAIQSITQLEDLRDEIGIGGSWSEFTDYLIASLKSDGVKLVIGGLTTSTDSAGTHDGTVAKLIAHKSKGMPLVTFRLNRLRTSSVNDAIANLSMELFKAFKSEQELIVKEQARSYHLTERLSAEKEKNESLQTQLNAALFSKKQRISTSSDESLPTAIPIDKPPLEALPVATKVSHRVVPAYRRAKVRGVLLDDKDDGGGN